MVEKLNMLSYLIDTTNTSARAFDNKVSWVLSWRTLETIASKVTLHERKSE